MATTAEQVAALQRQNNEMYIQSAREQMDFQERMSNTAHQREVADMIKSGLNPVLSATGGQGATTPNGAQANVDAQSMVEYLLTEMNNENARQINSAQVAAQRYAAEMSYKSAQLAANAQIVAAQTTAGANPLVWLTNALSDPNSPQAKAANVVLSWFGIELPKSGPNLPQIADSAIQSILRSGNALISEKKATNLFYAAVHTPTQYALIRPNVSSLIDVFRMLGWNNLADICAGTFKTYSSHAK